MKIGLFTALFIAILVLKLAMIEPVAAWSWWWVTSPLWITLITSLVCYVIGAMVALVELAWARR